MTNYRAIATRLVWTFVSAAGGAVGSMVVLDVSAAKAAVFVGLTATVNALTLVARDQLAALPEVTRG
jgi:hypothetical protein